MELKMAKRKKAVNKVETDILQKMSASERFRNKSLIYKISVVTALMLVICLTLLIAISATLAGRSLSKTVNGEFEGIATENGLMVQNVINTASNTASILQDYMQKHYDEFSEKGYKGTSSRSAIYTDVDLQQLNKEAESFIISVATTVVKDNEGICGVGVFFEQNAFDPAIKDYTVYVNEENAKTGKAQSYGEYETYSTQDYYREAAKTQQNSFTDPYQDQGMHMISASFPITYNLQTKGVVLVDINLDTFSSLRAADSKYPSMYVDILNPFGTMIYDSESVEYIGQSLKDLISERDYAKIQAGMDTGESFSVSTRKNDGTKIVRYYAPINAAGQTWWAASALSKKDLNRSTVRLVLMMAFIALATLGVIIALSSRLLRKYIKPIAKVVGVAGQLAQGDFNVSIATQYQDEIGGLANTFSEMAGRLRATIEDITNNLKEMAAGNFDVKPGVEHVGDFKAIEDALVSVVSDLSHTLRQINEASEMVASNAAQISDGAQSLTEGAMDQANSVDELQSTIMHVTDQVEKNAQNANAANELAKVVGNEIIASNEQMQQVVNAMETINQTSLQIRSIINTINDIADQTNLLALNASIEAARAGEAGRGFSVVATQVGVLAAQSAEASQSSNALIIQAMNAVEEGKSVVDQTAAKLLESVDVTNKLVKNIEEITQASQKQSESLGQVSEAANQIAAVIQENTAMAEESSASSEELAAQAEKLKNLIGEFRLQDEE